MRKTRIIATIGPATHKPEVLEQLARAGMNIARFNMSHGDHDATGATIRAIHELNRTLPQPVGILLDTQGPEIRTGKLSGAVDLKEGEVVTISVRGNDDVESSSIQIHYADLLKDVQVGDRITVDNGLINFEVLQKGERQMECRVIDGGVLTSRRHVNLPGIRVNLPAITDKDREDILFGLDQGIDFIALSFVREAEDVRQLRALLGERGKQVKIIAKIEDHSGVENAEEIIREADGVMVARGDLGVEVPIEMLPRIQRRIVRWCAIHGKRVIVATHMLESMIENPMPTRAEVTDVANAVYEEADAIMLSGETSVGKYPVKCVEMLDRIARSIESSRGLRFTDNLMRHEEKQQIAFAAVKLAESISAKAILVPTRRGRMAGFVTNCHPQRPVICAFTNSPHTLRHLVLNRNVMPFHIDFADDPDETLRRAAELMNASGHFEHEDRLVVISDTLSRSGAEAILVRSLGELLARKKPGG